MIKFHYINLNGEGAVVLGYRRLYPEMECMVVRLRNLREKDEQDLMQIVSEPEIQKESFLFYSLMHRLYPRVSWGQNWMAYLGRYVEMIKLSDLDGIMDHEQHRIYTMLWKAYLAKTTPPKPTVENTLYSPVEAK